MYSPQPTQLIQEAGGGASSRPVAPPGGKPLVKRCHKAKGELTTKGWNHINVADHQGVAATSSSTGSITTGKS